jgi:hypothetical protein
MRLVDKIFATVALIVILVASFFTMYAMLASADPPGYERIASHFVIIVCSALVYWAPLGILLVWLVK